MNLEKILADAFKNPTPKQEEFYKCKTRFVGYGGSRGGGKSHAVRCKATLLAYEYPGIQMLIIRRTLPELRENHVNKLMSIYNTFPDNIKAKYNAEEKAFVFPNGSRLKLGYCDNENDVLQFQGQEYDILFLDEATQLTDYQYGCLCACVRGTNKLPKRIYLTCNPGGVGHAWVKRLFIDKEYRKRERPSDYTFIQARMWDNLPFLMCDDGFNAALKEYKRKNRPKVIDEKIIKECAYESDYVRSLGTLSKELQEAWINGDWNVFSGQYFTEFDENVHVIEPFQIPEHWRKSAAIDYGLDCFAVLWFAVDEKGQVYCYRNYECSNLIVTSAAAMYKELTHEFVNEVVAPPDMWSKRQDTGKSVFEIFSECGIPLIKAGNERIAGWLNVKEYLKVSNEKPRILFFNNCTKIIKNISLLQYDPKKINDVAVEPHDITHSPDALRYWCSRWQLGTKIKPQPVHYNFACEKPKTEGWEVTEDYLLGGY